MAITVSVLTGGSNNHQTTSEEANAVYTDFVSEGIVGSTANTSGVAPATGGFAVNAQGTPDMTVAVSSGVAYVNGTPSSQNNQTFRVKNSASSNVTISANSSGSTKYDWVYISLSSTNLNTPNTAGDNVATLVTSRSSSAASDDGTPPTYGYPIAVVTVANGASTITNGNIRDIRSQVALNTGSSNSVDGWVSLSSATTLTTATGYNKGNREFDLTSSADMTGVLTPGMRLKVTRGTTPPTQCTDLESGSSQYWSKSSPSGITFTDDFTCEAWIKVESYKDAGIVSRYDGTSGFMMYLGASGQLIIFGKNSAGTADNATTYQTVPLGRWVHVAATLDMSGATATTYIDGVSVSNAYTNGTSTSLTQAGNLQAGAYNGASFFDGEIADVRVWSAIRTATQIRDNMHQQLVGNETNLVAYYKLDGNGNDSTSNANNLTGSGGAVATTVDNPMNSTEYAIVTKITASTITVFTGTDSNIPNLTLSNPYYSTQASPFGFPIGRGKWIVETEFSTTKSTTSTTLTSLNEHLSVPTGAWRIAMRATVQLTSSVTNSFVGAITMSSDGSTQTNPKLTCNIYQRSGTAASNGAGTKQIAEQLTSTTAQTNFTVLGVTNSASVTLTINNTDEPTGVTQHSYYVAECSYL